MSQTDRILVFDGYCHLCSGWARFVKRHPVEPPFHLVAMQSNEGRAFVIARVIPAPLRDAMYRVLARNRYRWFGRRQVCYRPGSEE